MVPPVSSEASRELARAAQQESAAGSHHDARRAGQPSCVPPLGSSPYLVRLVHGYLTVLGILMERNRSLTVAAQLGLRRGRMERSVVNRAESTDCYRAATVR